MKETYSQCPKCEKTLSELTNDATGYTYCKRCERWFAPSELGKKK